MIVLLYKEACFSANEIDSSLPSVVVSLLQDFDEVFPEEMPIGLPPIRGIEHQIDLYPEHQFQTGPHIEVIPRRQRNFKDRLKSSWKRGMFVRV